MRDASEHAMDDDIRQTKTITCRKSEPDDNPLLQRSKSELAFQNLTRIEKKFSKLGDQGYRQKDFYGSDGQINGFHVHVESYNGQADSTDDNGLVFNTNGHSGEPSGRQIVSSRGSIRGIKNRVRASLEAFIDSTNGQMRNYRELEKGKVIIFTTSMTVVRETAERCNAIRKILQTHMVRYEEKDLFMSKENQKEFMERLGQHEIRVPQVFIDGIHLGGAEAMQALNESGELRERLQKFSKVMVRSSCDKCGGYRFMPCLICHGSKKSLHRNDFTEEFCALRCMQCDENGLMRCDMCLDQQE